MSSETVISVFSHFSFDRLTFLYYYINNLMRILRRKTIMEEIKDLETLKLYRVRIIPSECILLKGDHIISCNKDHLITTWETLHPKNSFDHGSSLYDFVHGLKISKFYKPSGELLYWYCDIVSYSYDAEKNELYVKDLLADVIIEPDGSYKVVDLDELALAFQEKHITNEEMVACLRQLNQLLYYIQTDDLSALQGVLTRAEEKQN